MDSKNLKFIVRDEDTGEMIFEEDVGCVFFGLIGKENIVGKQNLACGIVGNAGEYGLGMLIKGCMNELLEIGKEHPEAMQVCKFVSSLEKSTGKKLGEGLDIDDLKE